MRLVVATATTTTNTIFPAERMDVDAMARRVVSVVVRVVENVEEPVVEKVVEYVELEVVVNVLVGVDVWVGTIQALS